MGLYILVVVVGIVVGSVSLSYVPTARGLDRNHWFLMGLANFACALAAAAQLLSSISH